MGLFTDSLPAIRAEQERREINTYIANELKRTHPTCGVCGKPVEQWVQEQDAKSRALGIRPHLVAYCHGARREIHHGEPLPRTVFAASPEEIAATDQWL